jgi:UDP-N-acetylmuramate--alanine ligase
MTSPHPLDLADLPDEVRTVLRPGAVVTDASWSSSTTDEISSIHVVRIGGAGMSAVARLALGAGITVSGSDSQDGQFIGPLRAAGARIGIVQVVVVSTAVRADNPEVIEARRRGVPVVHRAAALAGLLAGRDIVAVAGTHGKTSTTSLAAMALRGAGEDPGWAIGAAVPDLGANAGLGTSEVAVIEADESDGSFLAFAPHALVVTNLEGDHLDFHGELPNLVAAFDAVTGRILPGGTLVVCADDAGSAALGERARARGIRVLSYGVDAGADARVRDEQGAVTGSRARLETPDGEVDLDLTVTGHHNVLNATGALLGAAAVRPAASLADLARGQAGFRGASRRFELRGTVDGVSVYDDYAHHPREVADILAAARGIVGEGRVLAVFQPHLFSRTRIFAAEFAAALSQADAAWVMPVYAAREDPDPTVDATTITAYDPSLIALTDRDAVPGIIADQARPGDVVMMLGAGDVVEETARVLDALARRG